MARPQKKGMDYFPHDTDAFYDDKIKKITAYYGIEAYAIYFILLERIYRSEDYKYHYSKDNRFLIANELRIKIDLLDNVVKKCLDVNLFDSDLFLKTKMLTSNGVLKRSGMVEEKREKYRNNKRDIAGFSTEKTHIENPEYGGNSAIFSIENSAESAQSKVNIKESKVKESREDKFVSKKESKSESNARARESYDEILDGNCSPIVASSMRDFIRHCTLNRHLLTNDKLYDIIVRLDMNFREDKDKCESIQRAIRGGYFDIAEKTI